MFEQRPSQNNTQQRSGGVWGIDLMYDACDTPGIYFLNHKYLLLNFEWNLALNMHMQISMHQ